MDGRNGRTDRRRQNYIPPTLSGDKKSCDWPGGEGVGRVKEAI